MPPHTRHRRRWAVLLPPLLFAAVNRAPPVLAQAPSESLVRTPAEAIAGAPDTMSLTAERLEFDVQTLAFPSEPPAGGGHRLLQGGVTLLEGLRVSETPKEILVEMASDVLFDFDSDALRPDARTALEQVTALIARHRVRQLRIAGHTDGKGTHAYNKGLSDRRARAVKVWLAEACRARLPGSGSIRMETQGFAATRPVAPNTRPDGGDDPAGRQRNRRVEITLLKG